MTLTIDLQDAIAKEGEVRIHAPHLTDAEFFAFCRRNPLLPIERTKEMDILVMLPADTFGDSRNAETIADLTVWNRTLPTPGLALGATAGFTLPNGAVRSPDAAWVATDRWNSLPLPLHGPFAYIAPDFVIEILSPSDRLNKAREKMEEYIENGVRLGWLIDRANRTVYLYRPNMEVATLDNPVSVSGDPEMPGFTVDMARVFQDHV